MSNLTQRRTGNVRFIFEEDDFPAVVSNVHPLEDNTTYIIKASPLTLAFGLGLSNVDQIASIEASFNVILYSGTAAFFSGTLTGTFAITNTIIISTTTTQAVWDITGNGNTCNNILISNVITFAAFDSIGTIDTFGGLNHSQTQYANIGNGLVLKDMGIVSLDTNPFNNNVTSNSPRIVMDGTFQSVSVTSNPLEILSGEAFIQYSKTFTTIGDSVVNGNQFSDALGGEFYASAKTGAKAAFSAASALRYARRMH